MKPMMRVMLLLVMVLPAAGLRAQTGAAVPGMESYDQLIPALMARWNMPGAAVAVMRNGRLIFARGYGYADTARGAPVMPDTLFRIASVSKPVTAMCIMRLVETGRLNLDALAFPMLNLGAPLDPRVNQITIRNLLEHTGGWDRDISFDPLGRMVTIARAMGVESPPDGWTIIRYMLNQPLQFDPGARHGYSNFGYLVLGRIIEVVTGQRYEDYAKSLLAEVGITRMRLAHTLPSERVADEAHYYDYPGAPLVNSVFDRAPGRVPYPDGGLSMEAHDANGGWLASSIDLVNFGAAMDGYTTRPDLLSAASFAEMLRRPAYEPATATNWYAKGWSVGSTGNHWHTGTLRGTKAELVVTGGGSQWAFLTNTRVEEEYRDAMTSDIDDTMWDAWNAYRAVPDLPTIDQSGSTAFAITGISQGAPSALTLSAAIQVAPADLGQPGSFFVAAIVNGQLWAHNGTSWVPNTAATILPHSSGLLGSRTIPVLSGVNVTIYPGAQIYAGYGTSAADMLAHTKYRRIYPAP